jgi:hypothetical protein
MKKSSTVAEYIGSGLQGIPTSDDGRYFIEEPDAQIVLEAVSLMMMYDSLTGASTSYVHFERRKRKSLIYFTKLVRRLRHYRANGLAIRKQHFIAAHIWYYGEELCAGHLVSDYSLKIYLDYMRQKSVKTVKMTDQEYDDSNELLVAFLAEQRGESIEEIQTLLHNCGLL